jgi:hypothetical protein
MEKTSLQSEFNDVTAAELAAIDGGVRGDYVLVGAAIGMGVFGFTPVGGFIGGAIGGAIGGLLDWLF